MSVNNPFEEEKIEPEGRKRRNHMKKFNVYLPFELFERVKLMAKIYNKSITKMMVELIEIGYIKMLENK